MNSFFVLASLLLSPLIGSGKDDGQGTFITNTLNDFRITMREYAEDANVPQPEVRLHINRPKKFEGRARVFADDMTKSDVWGVEVDPTFLMQMSEHRKKYAAAFLVCNKKLGGVESTQLSVNLQYLKEVKRCACLQLGLVMYIEIVLEDRQSSARTLPWPVPTRDQIAQELRNTWGEDLPLHPKARR